MNGTNEHTQNPVYERPATPYADALSTWAAVGYAVVPASEDKRPACRWGDFSRYASTDRGHRAPSDIELRRWRDEHGESDAGCLILDSNRDRPLVVVDVDERDDALFAWVRETFGETPLEVTSGRGRHFFYRAPSDGWYTRVTSRSGMIGPRDSFADKLHEDGSLKSRLVSPIDIKAAGAYTLASGSWHAGRSRPYVASSPITVDLLESLPEFDRTRYEALVDVTTRARRLEIPASEFGGLGRAELRRRLRADRRREQMSRAGYKVGVSEFDDEFTVSAAMVPDVGQRGPCPFHDDKSRRSMSVFVGDDGQTFAKCWSTSCGQRVWRVVYGNEAPKVEQRVEREDLAPIPYDVMRWIEGVEPAVEVEAEPAIKIELPDFAVDSAAIFGLAITVDLDESGAVKGPHGGVAPVASHPGTGQISGLLRSRFGATRTGAAITDGRYLRRDVIRDVADHRLVVLRAPTGVGKTETIRDFIDWLRAVHGPGSVWVVSITHRRTLSGSMRWRLELRATHLDSSGRVSITPETATSIALCADSLPSLMRQLDKIDRNGAKLVTVIDESESVFAHMATCARGPFDRGAMWSSLCDLLLMSDRVILADATMSDFSLSQTARAIGIRVDELVEMGALIEDRRPRAAITPLDVVWLDRSEDARIAAETVCQAGLAPFFHCGSIKRAKAMHAELAAAYPDRVFALVTGDHDDPEGRAFLEDANRWITANRGRIGGVIATTALESGVSCDVSLVDGVADSVIVEAEAHMTWTQTIQAASRARRAARWYVHAPASGFAAYTVESDLRRALVEGKEDTSRALTRASNAGWTGAASMDRVIVNRGWFDAYVEARVHVDRARMCPALDLWRYLTAEGYDVAHPHQLPDAEARKANTTRIRNRAQVIREDAVNAIAAAEPGEMTVAEAAEVMERHDRIEDKPAAQSVLIGDFYGETSMEAIEMEQDGGRDSIRRYADLAVLLQGDAERLKEGDRREFDLVGTPDRVRRACVTWSILDAFGVTPGMVMGTAQGDKISMTVKKKPVEFEGLTVSEGAVDYDRVWQWVADRRIRDALKTAVGIDPWMQIPKGGRSEIIDALKAWNDAGCGAVSGLDYSKENADPRHLPELPNDHTLSRLLTGALNRLGLVSKSRQIRVGGERVRVQIFDLDHARKIRRLASAQYQRMTGQALHVETPAEMKARHAAELAEVIERVDAGWAEPEAVDAVIERHGVELDIEGDAVIGRGAGGPVQPESHQIARIVSTMTHFWCASSRAPEQRRRAHG